MTEKLKALKVDDALAAGTDIGPVVDPSQLEQDLRYLEIGKGEGAKLAFGGERLKRATEGYYLSPALFTDADNGMRIAREEIFGPVACVIRAQGLRRGARARQRHRVRPLRRASSRRRSSTRRTSSGTRRRGW